MCILTWHLGNTDALALPDVFVQHYVFDKPIAVTQVHEAPHLLNSSRIVRNALVKGLTRRTISLSAMI